MGRNQTNGDKVLVLVALSSAFNSVDRSAFLSELRRVAPQLAPWADYCYGVPYRLVLGSHILESARGIQQGDPLGPALFAISIHDRVLRVRDDVRGLFPG